MEQSKKQKYVIEVILFMTYALFAMSWKAGDMLIGKMGFNASETAVMTNAINAAKIIGSLSAASLISKLGNRKVFSFSTFLIALGVLIPFASGSFTLIFLIRFILGLGGAFVLVTINPTVAKLFSGEELTVVNGLNAVAFNVGLAVVLSLAKTIALNPGLTIKIISLTLIFFIVIWNLLSKSLEDNPMNMGNISQNKENYGMGEGLKDRFNWIFSLSYSGLLGFYLVSFTFMKPENVKYVIYMGVVGALVGTFQAKKFKDKVKLVRITAFLQLISAILFMVFYNSESVKIIGMALGFLIFFPMSAFVTLAFTRKDTTPKKISVTFSIFWALSYFVSIILVQIFAFLKDSAGENTAFIFILCAEASFFIGNMFFMKKEKGE